MTEAIGMMEGAFFVPRTELLQWLNSLLDLNLQRVEQCASGAVYIQVMDACFPGKVPMSKVNYVAKHEYEFVKNYKVLQNVFDKCGVQKHIEVERLCKAKYQDNLEFLQWLKRYADTHMAHTPESYDAVERRKVCGPMPDWARGITEKGGVAKKDHLKDRRGQLHSKDDTRVGGKLGGGGIGGLSSKDKEKEKENMQAEHGGQHSVGGARPPKKTHKEAERTAACGGAASGSGEKDEGARVVSPQKDREKHGISTKAAAAAAEKRPGGGGAGREKEKERALEEKVKALQEKNGRLENRVKELLEAQQAPLAPRSTLTDKDASACVSHTAAAAAETEKDREMMQKQREELEELKVSAEEMEKERDFYFDKLRQIEIICQRQGGAGELNVETVLEILYAKDGESDEEDGDEEEGEEGKGEKEEEDGTPSVTAVAAETAAKKSAETTEKAEEEMTRTPTTMPKKSQQQANQPTPVHSIAAKSEDNDELAPSPVSRP
uniref:Calponin-homology (CH) domain-containing protein n=1 Tax=Chromera velia CCMP2878 TaxID=1169474 RepID=A0A0G4HNU6_9ALVE|eukprot:Cvel_7661.t1-p1 / transcript=Cvel_7661.t1 / gene=Cvel_7661 / organism=Chromera_velia_CCMP2878 / gene_product=Microtubule-associated protein RP/EB family member, putative / transcript_product=Microtubule-associated protein RP/EB family member, putative / location=Cvel_scaffold406:23563-30786(-) / protein_length=492 / sequence_SO=supercontig / SO=protein_coding / is_pseudo=false